MPQGGRVKSYLSHLECTETGETYSADEPHGLSPAAQKVLYPRYDLEAAKREIDRNAIAQRSPSIWRFFEMMPVRDEANPDKYKFGMRCVQCIRHKDDPTVKGRGGPRDRRTGVHIE